MITAGDLVVCVDACCEMQRLLHLGKIRIVRRVSVHETECTYCGHTSIEPHASGDVPGRYAPLWWLKKIDPSQDPEHECRAEKIAA